MKNLFSFVGAIVMIMAFTMSAQSQDWTKEQKEVWKVVTEGWENWKNGNVDEAMEGLHEKFQGWNAEYPLPANKEKVIKLYTTMKDNMKVLYYDIEPARITVTENGAVVHYYFTFYAAYTMGEKSTEKEIKGKNAEFFVKEKGKWLLLGDMTFFKEGKD